MVSAFQTVKLRRLCRFPGRCPCADLQTSPIPEVPGPPSHPSLHAAEVLPLCVSPAPRLAGRCRCPVAAEAGTALLWALGKAGRRGPRAGLGQPANGTPPRMQLQRLPHRLWPRLQNKRLASAQNLGWGFLEGEGPLTLVPRISPSWVSELPSSLAALARSVLASPACAIARSGERKLVNCVGGGGRGERAGADYLSLVSDGETEVCVNVGLRGACSRGGTQA